MPNVFDFDAFRAEHEGEPLVVKGLFGKDWTLPGVGQIPATNMLMLQRKALEMQIKAEEFGLSSYGDDEDVPAALLPMAMDLAQTQRELYLGAENVKTWMEAGISDEALRALLDWAEKEHEGTNDDDDDEESDAEGN